MAIEENTDSRLEKRSRSSHLDQKLVRNNDAKSKQNCLESLKKTSSPGQDGLSVENEKGIDRKSVTLFSRRTDAMIKSKSAQNKTSPDQKSVKSLTSDCLSACSRERKYEFGQGKSKDSTSPRETYKMVYHEGFEVVPFLVLAAQKQGEIVRMMQYEKIAFRRKLMERSKEGESYGLQYRKASNNENQGSEPYFFCKFDAFYGNLLDEISCIWINLFYFILNLRVNLIKILNKSGKESFVPNIVAERDILSRAVESVRVFSVLKMKILSDALDKYNHGNDSKKPDLNVLENEDLASSPFICEMEFMGSKVKEIVGRIKKVNEKQIKA